LKERRHKTQLNSDHLFANVLAVFGDGDYLGGSGELTVADVPLAVELNRWNVCVHALRCEGYDVDVPALPRLARWYVRLSARHSKAEHC
jgi:glutathione S-transferase